MLINLGDVDTIYLGRGDTLIAYIKGEDAKLWISRG